MSSVTLRNLTKSFGDVDVIHGISVDIADGEFVTLIGPSGCGKSTLLRMIAGLEEITGGDVEIDGKVVNSTPSKDRDIAMVFQSYALYPHLTVRDNMAFSLSLRKAPKAEIEKRVSASAEILGLSNLLDRFPRQLSGGQRQRVAMGRALVRDPKVFLFDEPLSNLDAKLRVQMRVEIKALHQRLKTTTIYVTHDQVEAMTMADKIVVMKDGFVEQIGEPIHLYDAPANMFVAQFIGSPAMNMIAGTVADGAHVMFDGIALPVPAALRERCQTGQSVHYGIRPEHLRMAKKGFEMAVDVVEPTGAETAFFGRLNGAQIVFNTHERVSARPGDVLHLQPELDKVHLFDSKTTRRI
ncbi:ABC transporter ATP-binding protein [Nitratireductor pacificus]|uniref:ABC transporter-like protein n=1 Tax=Nitratireductor pacificus pht-3B TaxID=391937 RepID=K2MM41_9HYPH|nr:sn-glycerol-3-phosphate ABC transporter ATP-binding protein UgpC [Nitratireductor pacificus]EKF18297.1 ABC transporter-like protein [Nitratireductor pacificus pht-3B]